MIYAGTNTTIRLDVCTDLSEATQAAIRYRKPNGEEGSWDATIIGTELLYKTKETDLDVAGLWLFQAVVELNGDVLKGEIKTNNILNPIQNGIV